MRKKPFFKKCMIHILFIGGCFIYLIPFLLALVNSLKTAPEAQSLTISFPAKAQFENYVTVIQEGKLLRGAANGLLYSVLTVAIVVILCSFAAFIIVRRNDRAAGFLRSYFALGIIVPTAMIPTYLVMNVLGLLGTYPGLILLYISGGIPMAIFLYSGFVNSVPRDLDEAAFIDGAGIVRTFYLVVFPVLKPVTSTVTVLTFMNVWNDFSIQLYYGTQEMRSMPLSVYNFFGKYSQSWNLVFADIILTMLPVLAVYFLGQKYIISGMTQGAVKG